MVSSLPTADVSLNNTHARAHTHTYTHSTI